MTTGEDHRRWRELLGAYVLGRLPGDEAVALLAHLDSCASCRTEELELREVAALLASADADALAVHRPPAWLGDRVLDAVSSERANRARRRRRVLAGAAAAIAAAVVLGVGVLTAGSDRRDTDATPLTFAVIPSGVDADAGLEVKPWGTTVWLNATGLEAGETYRAWLERADGSRVSAGTFRPGPERFIRCYLTAAITPGEAVAFGVSTPSGRTVLRAAVG